jgi:hypothetical protein
MKKDQIAAVLERVRTWPAARQEDAARLLLEMEAHDASPYRLTSNSPRCGGGQRRPRNMFRSPKRVSASTPVNEADFRGGSPGRSSGHLQRG